MMKNRILIAIIFLVFTAIVIYTLSGGEETDATYKSKLDIERKDTNRFMRNSDESPFPESEKKAFKGLNYYEPNQKYRVKAKVKPAIGNKILLIPTTDGKDRKYIKYGFAEFEIDGKAHQLLLLQDFEDKNRKDLFLAFADATNGNETYGGGRYLDVKIKKANQKVVEIDFNKAYNPYCVYNYNYSCPLPPKENILEIAIEAGEKNYELKEFK
jgi:uncharacterized protein